MRAGIRAVGLASKHCPPLERACDKTSNDRVHQVQGIHVPWGYCQKLVTPQLCVQLHGGERPRRTAE